MQGSDVLPLEAVSALERSAMAPFTDGAFDRSLTIAETLAAFHRLEPTMGLLAAAAMIELGMEERARNFIEGLRASLASDRDQPLVDLLSTLELRLPGGPRSLERLSTLKTDAERMFPRFPKSK